MWILLHQNVIYCYSIVYWFWMVALRVRLIYLTLPRREGLLIEWFIIVVRGLNYILAFSLPLILSSILIPLYYLTWRNLSHISMIQITFFLHPVSECNSFMFFIFTLTFFFLFLLFSSLCCNIKISLPPHCACIAGINCSPFLPLLYPQDLPPSFNPSPHGYTHALCITLETKVYSYLSKA